MAPTPTKRFSSVRYWRYVFTPILLLSFIVGLGLLYTTDVSPLPVKPSVPSNSIQSGLNALRKLATR
jgi:hypothetical protein